MEASCVRVHSGEHVSRDFCRQWFLFVEESLEVQVPVLLPIIDSLKFDLFIAILQWLLEHSDPCLYTAKDFPLSFLEHSSCIGYFAFQFVHAGS